MNELTFSPVVAGLLRVKSGAIEHETNIRTHNLPLKTVLPPSLFSKQTPVFSPFPLLLLETPNGCPATPRLFSKFDETVKSEESAELVGDSFAEVAAAIVADYEAGEMPMPGNEDFAPMFKKWIKVTTAFA